MGNRYVNTYTRGGGGKWRGCVISNRGLSQIFSFQYLFYIPIRYNLLISLRNISLCPLVCHRRVHTGNGGSPLYVARIPIRSCSPIREGIPLPLSYRYLNRVFYGEGVNSTFVNTCSRIHLDDIIQYIPTVYILG
jgi:hypothetical protein